MADKTINLIYKILGIDKANQQTRKLDSNLDRLAKRAVQVGGAFFTAQGIIKVLNAIAESAQSAQRVQDLETAMLNLGKNAGFGADSLEKFREATNGTITDTQLLTSANTALLLGIVENDNEMGELLDTAQRLGKAMGVDTAFAVNSLTIGLGRQSRLMLDNLGIMVDVASANKALAEAQGVSVSQLDEEERKRAFLNEAMRQARSAVNELGEEQLGLVEKQQQFEISITNLSNALGEKFAPQVSKATTLFTNFINSVTSFIEDEPAKDFEGLTEEQIRLTKSIEGNTKASIRNSFGAEKQAGFKRDLIQANKDANEIGKQETTQQLILESAMEDTSEAIEELTNRELIAIQSFDVMRTTIESGVESFKKLDVQLEEDSQSLNKFSELLTTLTPNQQLAIQGIEQFGGALAHAVVHGQNLGDAVVSSLKSIGSELLAKSATFALMNVFTGGGASAAGGLGSFLLQGFTGQTSKVNQTININGGLVSQSYVKNTLLPAINNARAIG